MHLDASGIIHAWDEYPLKNFPGFWGWVESRIVSGRFKICVVAFEEVKHKYPECADWLKSKAIHKIELSNEILVRAAEIKELLEIEEEAYGTGVDENDLIIIASANIDDENLLTQENKQPFVPNRKKKNYKIPLVGGLTDVGVECLNVRELIVASGEVFG